MAILRLPLLAAALLAPPAIAAPPAVAPATGNEPRLAVALPPAAPRDALRKTLLQPFAAIARHPVTEPKWDGADPAALPAGAADVVLLPAPLAEAGCRTRTFARLDWSRLPRDRFLPQTTGDCAAGAYLAALTLAWDKDKIAAPPSWSDFWDVARRPGRRGLPRQAQGALEFALLADGVPPADIYRTLRTDDGLDRAFRKLDQLKPYIAWWDKPEQPGQWLLSGNALMVAAPAAAIASAAQGAGPKRHLGLQWTQALLQPWVWAVPAGAPGASQAALFLLMAADIGRQAALAQATFLAPTLRDALGFLTPAELAVSAAAPANLDQALPADSGFWAERGTRLQQRFEAWAAK